MAVNDGERIRDLVLSNIFTGYRSQKKIDVKLYKTYISAETTTAVNKKEVKKWVINFIDVIGCHVRKLERNEAESILLYIFYYPLNKTKKVVTRKRYCHKILIDTFQTEAENRKLAELWRHKISYYIKNMEPVIDVSQQLPTRNMLIFLNPIGGTGSARKLYKTVAVPMFEEADIKHKLIVTEYAGHAKTFCANEDLSPYDGIVVAGGDGVIYEIINGIMSRKDWERFIKIPLGVIPAGSGNALAVSTIYQSTGAHFIDNIAVLSVFEICKGFVREMDVSSVEQLPINNTNDQNNPASTKRNITFANLGVIFGFIADIDIEGEKLRFLGGETRNVIYALLRLATFRKYHAIVSYLPDEQQQKHTESKNINANNALESGDAMLTTSENFDNICLESPKPGVCSSSLLKCPPLSEGLPDSWVTRDISCVQILSSMQSHIAQGKMVCKDLSLSTGSMFFQVTTAKATRKTILDMWDALDAGEGNITNNQDEADKTYGADRVCGVTCRAFRLIPTPKHSKILTVDGEVVEFGPIQCEVHKGLARTFCSNKN